MRRLLLSVLVLTAVVAGAAVSTGAGDDARPPRYAIVFDNASGLVEGGDLRVGGVTVGAISRFDVTGDARARVDVEVQDRGFGGLTSESFCEIRQQSLIGEYYVECEPGSGTRLPDGATVPVKQTASPIPFDLVQNIMRRPYRERLSILLSELGAGFAARGEDVNETIRRGVPALRETNRVLDILGDNRRTLRALAGDSGRVLKVLGRRRKDVGRFVVEARDAAATTAERRTELAETFRRFPGFLREFTPTLSALGTAARRQAPALADLGASAPALTNLLATLPPFARAAEPAVTSLAGISGPGRRAAREAAGTVALLERLGRRSPEPLNNLALVLNDLDDRGRAVEKDPDSPGGEGYTGLEAILQYPFDQTLAFNIFDTRGYILKLNALVNECDAYTNAEEAKADPERTQRCSSGLGPNQPGVTTPDPSPPSPAGAQRTRAPTRAGAPDDRRREPAAPRAPGDTPAPAAPGGLLPGLLDRIPELATPPAPAGPSGANASDLLDFLLGA